MASRAVFSTPSNYTVWRWKKGTREVHSNHSYCAHCAKCAKTDGYDYLIKQLWVHKRRLLKNHHVGRTSSQTFIDTKERQKHTFAGLPFHLPIHTLGRTHINGEQQRERWQRLQGNEEEAVDTGRSHRRIQVAQEALFARLSYLQRMKTRRLKPNARFATSPFSRNGS